MPRRSLLLLAAAVVMLYFLIIMFMLSPLNGSKSTYYGHGYMNHFSYRQLPAVNWCKELRWRSPPAPHVVALVSYPGSGNTWLRYLLQQATGIVTGSIYMDHSLRVHGFPAENITDGSVLVVKTHEAPPIGRDKFKSAILLIRNPRDAILADFNRLHKGHIGTAPKSAFKKKSHEHKKTDWATYVSHELVGWESLHRLWLTRFAGAVHVVFYEALVQDTRAALQGILGFINHTISEADMNCAISFKEGIYRRKKKLQNFDPFTSEMYSALDEVRNRVLTMVVDYQKKHNESVRDNTVHQLSG
ncbi:WSCD family member AAEL009094 [Ostrinia nubilalis]|uniref:WSCD family member AAEL009094 n=1 Tax=Ostrinia nubilalis TaxID=29057 RepID=UPI0030825AAB